MKKIYILLCLLVLFVACGKKEYEKLSKRDIAMILYQAEVLGDKNVQILASEVESYLYSKESSDKNAAEQIQLWTNMRNLLMSAHQNDINKNRNWFSYEKEEFPSLGEVFGKENEGVSGNYRLYTGIDDKTGESVVKDILTDAPFTGVAIFRTKSGKIEEVVSYDKGIEKELLIESTFYDNNIDVYSMRYYKDGQLYKERFYEPNGEFKTEEFVR